MPKDSFVIGVDFGTDSVRSVLVDVHDGQEVAASVYYFPRWRDGLYCDSSSNRFRQHPLDYIEGLQTSIVDCLSQAGNSIRKYVKAISADTTGSTPVAVDRKGTPLALLPGFEENPNAMFVLWKDHTATREAAEINECASRSAINYLKYVGGIYSSEWFWAKLLRVLREDQQVRNACSNWIEHCDWIPFLLTGGEDILKVKRGVCAAGHKALWAPEFGGLPPDDFFASIDPLLTGFVSRMSSLTYTADHAAGALCPKWAEKLGLTTDVIVGIGAFDCHMGAVGGQIEPYHLSKVMGTSTCDMMIVPPSEIGDRQIRGICGQVNGSILPGMIGLEAGQSAFGDTYAWYRSLLSWPLDVLERSGTVTPAVVDGLRGAMIRQLSDQASQIPLTEDAELAVDWLNGRRTPDANQLLKGAITGLTLASDAPSVFRAWVEATCFGARAIVDRFRDEGVPVKGLIGLGGVARKSPFIMQVMADVMNTSIRIHRSEQTCALGAAMFAATAAGIYQKAEHAMQAMGQGFDIEYHPRAECAPLYDKRYLRYRQLAALVEEMNSHSKVENMVTSA